jgi:hypothetical protein
MEKFGSGMEKFGSGMFIPDPQNCVEVGTGSNNIREILFPRVRKKHEHLNWHYY